VASKFTLPRKKEKQGIQGNPPLVCMKLPRNINEREKFWAFELVVLQSSIIMYGGIINLLCAKQGSDLLYRHSLSFLLCWKKQANKKRQKQKKNKKQNAFHIKPNATFTPDRLSPVQLERTSCPSP